ncbi:MAG TPA: ATP-grasp domain-containing protein [Thermoleophilia bacterium]|nr:ATP-grasp domain-containing protein [Thermoleophilia bacterium]
MDLYEYQGKRLFAAAGLPVPEGARVTSAHAGRRMAGQLGVPVVAKAQALTGGRGKAGGVQRCETTPEVFDAVARIMALRIKDKPVESVLLERAVAIAHEYYLAFTLDRHERAPVLLFSTRGGVDIETVARETPEALLRFTIDPLLGLADYQVRDVVAAAAAAVAPAAPAVAITDPAAAAVAPAAPPDDEAPSAGEPPGAARPVAWSRETSAALADVVRGLWRLYRDLDATLVEVNPLVVTAEAGVVCLDSKVTIDDNALDRHDDLAALRAAGDEREARARAAGLSYVSLDGDLGVIGNGAGLVMSTLDLVAAAGGTAANFCDVGGGARAEAVGAAVDVILSDPGVRALLVSIFGGITRGEEVARGLLAALARREGGADVPVVVRLDGNGATEGRRLLAEAGLPRLRVAAGVDEAVAEAVAAAKAAGSAATGPAASGPAAPAGAAAGSTQGAP